MVAVRLSEHVESADADHIVVLQGATWADYQRAMEMRGDRPVPRVTFSQGELQLMSPSRSHESIKSTIGRLVEAYCLEKGIEFQPVGAWTLERKELERGIEPDECYLLGADMNRELPDLAIEVIWTSGGMNKLEVYRAIGVREVWVWRRGRLTGHILRDGAYVESRVSDVLPGLDLEHLASFVDRPSASQSVREYRAALDR